MSRFAESHLEETVLDDFSFLGYIIVYGLLIAHNSPRPEWAITLLNF